MLEYLTCQPTPVGHSIGGLVLDAIVYLKSFPVWVEIIYVQGITMPETGGVQSFAIVVNHHVAIDDFITAVLVHVGYHIVVVAVAKPIGTRCGAMGRAVPFPACGEFMGGGVHVEGDHLVPHIDATTKEDAGFPAIKIGGSKEIFG